MVRLVSWNGESKTTQKLPQIWNWKWINGNIRSVGIRGTNTSSLFVSLILPKVSTITAALVGTHATLNAHSIGLNSLIISFAIPLSISIGTSIRIGNLLGEGLPLRAKASALTGAIINTSIKILEFFWKIFTFFKVWWHVPLQWYGPFESNLEGCTLMNLMFWRLCQTYWSWVELLVYDCNDFYLMLE